MENRYICKETKFIEAPPPYQRSTEEVEKVS